VSRHPLVPATNAKAACTTEQLERRELILDRVLLHARRLVIAQCLVSTSTGGQWRERQTPTAASELGEVRLISLAVVLVPRGFASFLLQ
jgi:hypothetical protein